MLPLAERAKELEKAIKEAYLFHIGEDKIELWHDDYNHEYLTHDGVWQARYLHQSYDVKCDAKTIFDYLMADYLVKNDYVQEYENNRYTKEGEMTLVLRYLNAFFFQNRKKVSNSQYQQ